MLKKLKPSIAENNERLKASVYKLIEAAKKDGNRKLVHRINALIRYVRDNKRISINLNIESLNEVLLSKEYLNISQLGYSEVDIKARYNQTKSTPYFQKFKAFQSKLDKNKEIKYGMLNTGGLGTNFPGFGRGMICIVLSKTFIKKLEQELHCLKTFSLNYFTSTLKFKKKKFFKDSSTWDYVEFLALEKHYQDIITQIPKNKSDLIPNKRGWLEVLIYSKINILDFQEIRIKKALYNEMNKVIDRESRSFYEATMKELYLSIFKTCEQHKIPINSI